MEATKRALSLLPSLRNKYEAGDRGIFAQGYDTNSIDLITISSISNASDFGDSSFGLKQYGHRGASNAGHNRGLLAGGVPGGQDPINVIEYLTISNTSNTIDFGDLTVPRTYLTACDNGKSDRAVFIAGRTGAGMTSVNTLDYVTISSIGNALDFGDAQTIGAPASGTSNDYNNRGLKIGGYITFPTITNNIEYLTITSLSNSTNFGDAGEAKHDSSATSNGINNRAIIFGGNNNSVYLSTIEYLTIISLSNSTNFGDLSRLSGFSSACSNKINQRAVCALGGGGGNSNQIEFVTMNSLGNSSNFGDLVTSRSYTSSTSNA